MVSPAGRAMPAGGRRSAGWRLGGLGVGYSAFARSGRADIRDFARQGGLCRLKPAFQAGGAVLAWRASGRWAA